MKLIPVKKTQTFGAIDDRGTQFYLAIRPNSFPGNKHWISAVLNVEQSVFIRLNVYGYNGDSKNKISLGKKSDVIGDLKAKYPDYFTLVGVSCGPDE